MMKSRSLRVSDFRRQSYQLAKRMNLKHPSSVHRIENCFWDAMENLDEEDSICVDHPNPIPSKSFPEEGRNFFVLPTLLKDQKTASRDLSFPLPSSISFSQDVDSQLSFRSLCCYTPWRQNSVPTATYIHSGCNMSCYICPEHSVFTLKNALDHELFHPELLIKQGCLINAVVLKAGDILILAPGSFSFNFSHGFQISERIGICFKPWLKRYLSMSLPKTLPIEFIVNHYALQAKKRLRNQDPDTWISLDVLLAEQELRDNILNKLRSLACAITQIHHTNESLFLLEEYFGKTCMECRGYLYFVSVHPLPEKDPKSSKNEVLGLDFRGDSNSSSRSLPCGAGEICLDCALKRHPPKSGYCITIPKRLGFSMTMEDKTRNVITQIQNGVSSALKKCQILNKSDENLLDLRLRCEHRLASVGYPYIIAQTVEEQQLEWTEMALQIHKRVVLFQKLLELEIPSTLTTNEAFDLKLRQLQISRAFKGALSPHHSEKSQMRWTSNIDKQMIESVQQQIQAAQPIDDGDQSSSTSYHMNEEQSCVEMLRRMESETPFITDSVRQVPVPRTGLSQSSPAVVVVPIPIEQQPPQEKRQEPKGVRNLPRFAKSTEMRITDRRTVVGSLRRVLQRKCNSGQNTNSTETCYLLASDVLKTLMTADDYRARCQNIPLAVQKIFRSIRTFSQTFPTPVELPTRPKLAVVEGVEQVIFTESEIHALYVTLYHNDHVIAQKLKSFVSGVWNLIL
eukprot:g8660.t1